MMNSLTEDSKDKLTWVGAAAVIILALVGIIFLINRLGARSEAQEMLEIRQDEIAKVQEQNDDTRMRLDTEAEAKGYGITRNQGNAFVEQMFVWSSIDERDDNQQMIVREYGSDVFDYLNDHRIAEGVDTFDTTQSSYTITNEYFGGNSEYGLHFTQHMDGRDVDWYLVFVENDDTIRLEKANAHPVAPTLYHGIWED